jgi:hypothetical protein
VVMADVESSEDVALESSDEAEDVLEPLDVVPVAVTAACRLADDDAAVPIEPSWAIAPNATAKVVRAMAATRRRRRAMRAARTRSLSLASSAGAGEGADMERTVGALPESRLGSGWELPEPAAVSVSAQRGLRLLPGSGPTISAVRPMEKEALP